MNDPIFTKKRRLARTLGILALFATAALIAWRSTTLRGLPDIGDPFDVAAFSAIDLRDEDNAAPLYREAAARLRVLNQNHAVHWSAAGEVEKSWLESNREALALWRKATERSDALFIRPADLTFDTGTDYLQKLRAFDRLVGLESSRLEIEGDFASAWEWHRAALRSSRHYGSHGIMMERLQGAVLYQLSAFRITAWANDRKVDAAMLRHALDEVRAIYAMTAPPSVAIKCEYLEFIQTMDRPGSLFELTDRIAGESPGRQLPKRIRLRAEALFKREPERSRRVLGLVVANWLACCDLPAARRPPKDSTIKLIFEVGPSAPESARVFPSDQLIAWSESTVIFKAFHPADGAFRKTIDNEVVRHANLVIHLASQLYLRERGRLPESPEELVGTYLDSLPEGLPTTAPAP
jgi:tetratricopeptide (TPR) repeat protein